MTSDRPGPDTARPLQGQSAYERLCEDIRSGVLRPGARLLETEIAERLQVSRTPVREAIRRLEAEGLVDHQPRTGAVVRKLDYPEIMELYEMRTVLEGTAARLAARAASDMELEELRRINTEMEESTGDPHALVRLNRQFHARLMDAARNRFLLKAASAVEKTLLIIGRSNMELPDRAREAVMEHASVVAGLTARDGIGAETAMRAHLENAQLARLRLLRKDLEGEE
ncbi:GntR family transcriptional regulator [Sagittula salina]|uniref:GntR family transcriptional regulator n=1 Tax=Sagittula salina TaxID=2820268 RepID=A0A940MX88_9RHOB|nr:GntR family transcriptional regulator [Sagittula salina]MBP0484544.1 GntR family transcriptional regulator [Sagittula salina]